MEAGKRLARIGGTLACQSGEDFHLCIRHLRCALSVRIHCAHMGFALRTVADTLLRLLHAGIGKRIAIGGQIGVRDRVSAFDLVIDFIKAVKRSQIRKALDVGIVFSDRGNVLAQLRF